MEGETPGGGLEEVGVESERGLCRRKRDRGGFAVLAPGHHANRLSLGQGAERRAPPGPSPTELHPTPPRPTLARPCCGASRPNPRLADLCC